MVKNYNNKAKYEFINDTVPIFYIPFKIIILNPSRSILVKTKNISLI